MTLISRLATIGAGIPYEAAVLEVIGSRDQMLYDLQIFHSEFVYCTVCFGLTAVPNSVRSTIFPVDAHKKVFKKTFIKRLNA